MKVWTLCDLLFTQFGCLNFWHHCATCKMLQFIWSYGLFSTPCPGKKVNHRQHWIEMPNRNTFQQNYVHWTLDVCLKEPQNFVRKYLLTVQLLIFKYRRQNILVYVTSISAFAGPEVTFADRSTLLPRGCMKPYYCYPWNTRIHRSNSLASQQSWPTPSKLLDLGKLQERHGVYTAAGLMTSSTRSRVWSKSGTFQPDDHWWSSLAVAFTSSSLHSST